MYDYATEMMKKYEQEKETDIWKEVDYSIISDGLYIVSREGKRPVDEEVRQTFKKKYKKYVKAKMTEIGDTYAIVMFQGTYRRIVPRNSPRNGMIYVEDNLRQVVKSLPKLERGERYAFPALRIVKNEMGVDFLVFRR